MLRFTTSEMHFNLDTSCTLCNEKWFLAFLVLFTVILFVCHLLHPCIVGVMHKPFACIISSANRTWMPATNLIVDGGFYCPGK